MVAGCIRQVVVLYSNNCMGICLGGRSTGHLKEVVILKRWLFEQVWLYIENLTSGLGGMKVIWMPLKMKTLLRVRNQNLLKETGFIWFWAIIWSPFWTLFICFFSLKRFVCYELSQNYIFLRNCIPNCQLFSFYDKLVHSVKDVTWR